MSDHSGAKASASERVAEGASRVAGSALGAAAAAHLSEWTDSAFREGAEFSRFAAQKHDCLQGRAFEFLNVIDFNRASQKAGSNLMARHCDSLTGPCDLEIFNPRDGRVVERIQAKSYAGVGEAIRAFNHEKYRGMTRLAPPEKAVKIKATLASRPDEYLKATGQDDVKRNLTGHLSHGGAEGRGVSRAQAKRAASSPTQVKLAVAEQVGVVALKEVGAAARRGAVSAGAMSLLFRSAEAALNDEDGRSHAEIISDVLSGSAAAAAKGGAVAGGAQTIAIAARLSGAKALAKSTAPTAMANTIYEAGYATYRYLTGDIDAEQYKEEAGGAVVRGTATFYCGMAGQVLIPVPVVGALVGATVGYVTSAVLVESGILGVGPSNIVTIESRRRAEIEEGCRIACRRLVGYQRKLEEIIRSDEALKESQILPAIGSFEEAILEDRVDSSIDALADLNLALGHTLPFRTLEEFDQFMLDHNQTLRL